MIRRSFRIGLWLGLLAGVGFAVAKIFRPKPETSSVLDLGSPGASLARSDWPPLEAAVPTPAPVQVPTPEVAPVVAAEEPGLVTIGDEPLHEPEPVPAQVPTPEVAPVVKPAAKTPAVKKAAAKKTPAAKKAATPAKKKAAATKPSSKKPAAKKPAAKKPAAKKPAAKKPAAKKPAAKKPAAKKKLPPWVDPNGTICPKTHPVKGKLSSMIFQVPGNFAYERTTPDRCYKTIDDAEDEGLRAAKR